MRKVLFYRDFRWFSGGHLKVWNYFGHVLSSPRHDPWVRFSKRSVWDDSNPWNQCRDRVLARRAKLDPEILFLAGVDWLNLGRGERRRGRPPVVNLIQHVKHAEPDDVRYSFLSHRAVRICVSEEVETAIRATGRVNGPVFTIPNGLDVDALSDPASPPTRDIDVLVVANKRPDIGRLVHRRLCRPDREVRLIEATLPRREFVTLLRRAGVSVFVPAPTEGFYLPALEAMALGSLVVCADCVGNRSFCLPGHNCFRPGFNEDDLVRAAEEALGLSPEARQAMLDSAGATAKRHDLGRERAAFLAILDDVEQLWSSG